jgi:hypothetical protein
MTKKTTTTAEERPSEEKLDQENQPTNTQDTSEFDAEFERLSKARDAGETSTQVEDEEKKEEKKDDTAKEDDGGKKDDTTDPGRVSTSGKITDEAAKKAADDAKKKADDAAKAASTTQDWRTSLPDEAKQHLATLEEERNKLAHKAASDAGRVSALTRRVTELEKVDAAGKKASAATADAEWKEFADSNPELAQRIEAKFEAENGKLAETQQLVDWLAQEQITRVKSERDAKMDQASPGWKTTLSSPEFKGWFAQQSAGMQALGESPVVEDAVLVIKQYYTAHPDKAPKKAAAETDDKKVDDSTTQQTAASDEEKTEVEKVQEKRQKQRQDATGVQTKVTSRESTTVAPDDFDLAFEFFAKKKELSTK